MPGQANSLLRLQNKFFHLSNALAYSVFNYGAHFHTNQAS
jgi:hypothetical protein